MLVLGRTVLENAPGMSRYTPATPWDPLSMSKITSQFRKKHSLTHENKTKPADINDRPAALAKLKSSLLDRPCKSSDHEQTLSFTAQIVSLLPWK